MGRFVFLTIFICSAVIPTHAQTPNTINTIAGGGAQAGTAKGAYLPKPHSAVRDSLGNTFIAVPALSTVYKVDTTGALTVYAGNGIFGFSGDGGPAAQAQLSNPTGLALDANNNIFIADANNNRIRRVDATTQNITTVAGSEDPGFGAFGGDGGPATNARLSVPQGVAMDKNGNLFIADTFNSVVRRVDGATQIITTYAGSPTANAGCPNGPATGAGFNVPAGVAVDGNGNLFISDSNLEIVCRVDSSQNISTFAGQFKKAATPGAANGDGGPATSGLFLTPNGLATDATGNLYIADSGDPKIRKVDTTSNHIITTVAGIGFICTNAQEPACGDGGSAAGAAFDFPRGVSANSDGSILVADTNNMRVRVISAGPNPTINAFAGGASGGDGAPAKNAILGVAQTLVVDNSENVVALETAGERIRKFPGGAAPGNITTVAGDGFGGATICAPMPCANGDGGPATSARFVGPVAIATNPQGNFYVVDQSAAVVRVINNQATAITVATVTIQPGDIATVAGNGQVCGATGNPNIQPACGDGGLATNASLFIPSGVAVDPNNGSIYISDAALHTVRMVNSTGTISTFVGTPGTPCPGYTTSPTHCGDPGAPASALLNQPFGVVAAPSVQFTGATDVFIADSGDNVIRKVDGELGTISTVAFNGNPGFGGDGGGATQAEMNFPQQIAVDELENLYIGGGLDNVVRRVDATDGTIITVAGDINNLDGGFRTTDDGGPSVGALLANFGVAVFKTAQRTHDLFIADSGSNRIRKVNLAPKSSASPASGTTLTFALTLDGQVSDAQLIFVSNSGLDDLLLTNFPVSIPNFTVVVSPGCNVVPPGGSCLIVVTSTPAAGANGAITGTLSFNSNDPAAPAYTYTLNGTASPTPFTLTVIPPPAGGEVSSDPSGILSCSSLNTAHCSFNFASGAKVTLVASAFPGFAFGSWNTANAPGANCTSDVCVVTMSQSQSIGANFVAGPPPGPATVTINGFGNGSGTVTSNPAGINCTITNGIAAATGCSANFTVGTQVTLNPAITGNSTFAGWLGFCSGSKVGPCTVPAFAESVGAVFSGPAQPFAPGQVFLSTDGGMVFVYTPTGTLVQVLSSGNVGNGAGSGHGMTFDALGNLYLATDGNGVETFSKQAAGPALFGNTPSYKGPFSTVVEPSGNVLVGQTGQGGSTVLQFAQGASSTTLPNATFFPAYEGDFSAASWIDLRSDGDTLVYTLGTHTVKVFDIGEQTQHPDLATNLDGAFALRALPDNSVLVADSDRIVRLDQAGNFISPYPVTIPGVFASFQNLNLDPDGTTFWTNDELSGIVYRLKISDGSVVSQFSTSLGLSGNLFTSIGGIAVFGQSVPSANLAVTKSHVGTFTPGQQGAAYTVTVSNAVGAIPTAGTVTVTETVPSGLTLVSMAGTNWKCAANSCTRADALAAGASYPPITVTVNVAANATSPQVNMVTVSGGDSPTANASDSTVITSTSSPALSITKSHSADFTLGQQGAQYTVTVSNAANAGPTSGSVNVTDAIPPGLSFVSMAGSGWNCASTACTRSDALAAGASYPVITVTVNVTAPAPTTVVNMATVTGGGSASSTASDSTNITAVPFTLTIVPPAGGSPGVPLDVSPGGQVAVGLLLTPIPGFSGTVTFSCTSSAPQFITCNPAPSQVKLSPNGTQVAVVVNTFCKGDMPLNGPMGGPSNGPMNGPATLGIELLLAALAISGVIWSHRRRSPWAFSFAVLLLIALGSAACGSLPKGSAGPTPAGNYTLFITATANGQSATVQQQIQVR